jgi:hypothetical protein
MSISPSVHRQLRSRIGNPGPSETTTARQSRYLG